MTQKYYGGYSRNYRQAVEFIQYQAKVGHRTHYPSKPQAIKAKYYSYLLYKIFCHLFAHSNAIRNPDAMVSVTS